MVFGMLSTTVISTSNCLGEEPIGIFTIQVCFEPEVDTWVGGSVRQPQPEMAAMSSCTPSGSVPGPLLLLELPPPLGLPLPVENGSSAAWRGVFRPSARPFMAW